MWTIVHKFPVSVFEQILLSWTFLVFSRPLAKPPVFGPSKQLDIELEMVSLVFTSSNQLYVCNVWINGEIT